MGFGIFFLKGLLTGFAVATPVGPIGILCIQRTLAKGREYGLVSGLGAATADALWGFVAAFCLLFIESFLTRNEDWLQLVGALFLFILGVRTFRSRPHLSVRPVCGMSLLRAFFSGFLITMTSPVTLGSILLVFVFLKVVAVSGNLAHALLLTSGVFLGSTIWWLIISIGMGHLRQRSDRKVLVWVNRVGGAALATCGFLIFMKLIF